MSSLKRAAWAWRWGHHDAQNSSLMSVTRCVSHVAMSPYRQTATRRASINQAATAARRLVSFITGPRCATPLQSSTVGAAVTVGAGDGAGDGSAVGSTVGSLVGSEVGSAVGSLVGSAVGSAV